MAGRISKKKLHTKLAKKLSSKLTQNALVTSASEEIAKQTKSGDSLSSEGHPRASLLGLPGELRNRIYRYVLVQPEEESPIRLTYKSCHQPALLKVNKQIRCEATKIFQEENSFEFIALTFESGLGSDHWLNSVSYTERLSGSKRCWKVEPVAKHDRKTRNSGGTIGSPWKFT